MTNTTGRTFGIEIETVGLSEDAAHRALESAGIDSRTASYSSRMYSAWSVKGDSSLSSPNGRAAEIVSPILTWGDPESYRQVETVAKALREAGARVNRSCGLHVHIGASDLTRTEALGIVRAYTAAQNSINTLVSPSRVDGQWARTYPGWGTRRWDNFREEWLRAGYPSLGRYMTVNLSPFADRGTVEFRQRNGSLNARKMLTWAGLVMSIVKMGAEAEERAAWRAYDETADVYTWLSDAGCLDVHADVWRNGARPVETPQRGSFARLLSLQGV